MRDHFGCVQLCDPMDCVLPGFSVRGFSKQECWSGLTHLSRALFPATLAVNSPEQLVLPGPQQPMQLHHLHTWHSLGKTQVLQGSLKNKPQWMTHMQRWG